MDKYQVGTIFQLYENNEQLYLIVSNVELESGIYLLVVPIDNEEKNTKVEYAKAILLKVNKETDEITIETDKDITSEVIEKTLEQMNK